MLPKEIKNEKDINDAMQYLLLDDFSVFGDDISLFEKIQKRIADCTYSITTPMRDIQVWSVYPKAGAGGRAKDDKFAVYKISADGTSLVREASIYPEMAGLADSQEIVQMLAKPSLIFQVWGNNYIISERALAKIGEQIGIRADEARKQSLDRDASIARRMYNSNKTIQLIIKSSNGLKKVFMAADESSTTLASILPCQEIDRIFDGIGGLGKPECVSWKISHRASSAEFSFPNFEGSQKIADMHGIPRDEEAVLCMNVSVWSGGFDTSYFLKLKHGYFYMDEGLDGNWDEKPEEGWDSSLEEKILKFIFEEENP